MLEEARPSSSFHLMSAVQALNRVFSYYFLFLTQLFALPSTDTSLVNLCLSNIAFTMTFHSGLAKSVARTKTDEKMGKVKQFVRDLRSRLSPSNAQTRGPFRTSHHLAAASLPTDQCRKSPSTPSTSPSSAIYNTSSTTSSNPERTIDQNADVEERHCTQEGNVDSKNIPHRHTASAHLPTSRSLTARGRSSESFPHRPLCHEQQMAATKLRQSRSHTLSLSSRSSPSTWSFACYSARRLEREHDDAISDSGSSFGSLSGWGVTTGENENLEQLTGEAICGETQDALPDTLPSHGPSFKQDTDDFDILPDWAIVEDDPDYNVQFVRDSDM
jgi:hypothetical protein